MLTIDAIARLTLPVPDAQRIIAKVAIVLDMDFPVTPHTFRCTCTTEIVRGRTNLYLVKELLGHESLETPKHYTPLQLTTSISSEQGAVKRSLRCEWLGSFLDRV